MDPKDLRIGERYQGKYGDSYTYQGFNGVAYVFIGSGGHLSYFDVSQLKELEWQSEKAVPYYKWPQNQPPSPDVLLNVEVFVCSCDKRAV